MESKIDEILELLKRIDHTINGRSYVLITENGIYSVPYEYKKLESTGPK